MNNSMNRVLHTYITVINLLCKTSMLKCYTKEYTWFENSIDIVVPSTKKFDSKCYYELTFGHYLIIER